MTIGHLQTKGRKLTKKFPDGIYTYIEDFTSKTKAINFKNFMAKKGGFLPGVKVRVVKTKGQDTLSKVKKTFYIVWAGPIKK